MKHIWIVAAVMAIFAIVALWWFEYSPQAKAKRVLAARQKAQANFSDSLGGVGNAIGALFGLGTVGSSVGKGLGQLLGGFVVA